MLDVLLDGSPLRSRRHGSDEHTTRKRRTRTTGTNCNPTKELTHISENGCSSHCCIEIHWMVTCRCPYMAASPPNPNPKPKPQNTMYMVTFWRPQTAVSCGSGAHFTNQFLYSMLGGPQGRLGTPGCYHSQGSRGIPLTTPPHYSKHPVYGNVPVSSNGRFVWEWSTFYKPVFI
jgi:hypothetical protein